MSDRSTRHSKYMAAYEARRPIYERLATMPPKSHWPDRSIPFDFRNSELIAFVLDQFPALGFDEAKAIVIQATNGAATKGVIAFDKESKLWAGTGDITRLY